ncbi:MAG TPA: DUF4139 domain-containing protein [Gemmatimonadaceae bacterium]|nr:DUF4139 domain-containing protein [Gemmatimonadaceae bacterium]
MSNRLPALFALAFLPLSVLSAQSVPVTKVMLFSSGVGYFEHAGTVQGNSSTELRFKTSQINDILKSLMLQDQDGGRIGTVTYPSQDPLSKTLKSFQVDIAQNPTLADLLNQLRGARVSVQTAGERLAGTVMGVEVRQKASTLGQPIASPVLNLLSGATIRSVELQSISNLSLDDPQLEDELGKALAALAQARDQDKKPVTIAFTGAGDRRVRIGYVVETPVWKTSYRLLLEPKSNVARIQGWAIVENQTESDWNNVSLSLVSGRPISFTMDLYQPLYAKRPNVVPELFASLRPQVYAGGISATADSVQLRGAAGGAAQRRIGYDANGRPLVNQLQEVVVTATGVAEAAKAYFSDNSVQSVANALKLGQLFQYTVGNVTLARQKSAMIPIITDTVCIERVSIFNARVLGSNPLNGVWFKNTTGKHLLQGPMTVLEKDAYAGDAQIDNVPPDQSRLVSYGIDLDVMVSQRFEQAESVVGAKVVKGTLELNRKLVQTTTYAADNKSAQDKELVIEHAVQPEWKLVDTPKPFETTQSVYRFKGAAPANKVTTLAVKQEWVRNETISLVDNDLSELLTYSRSGQMPKSVRDALAQAVQLKQAVADLDQQITARTQQIGEITAEQTRIRENMRTVAPNSQYYDRLLSKLNEQESTIEKVQGERKDLMAKRDAARAELQRYLETLNVN